MSSRRTIPDAAPPGALHPLPGYARVRVVDSFEALVAAPLEHGVNALCWPRPPQGDLTGLLEALATVEELASVDEELLATHEAAAPVLADLARLRALGLDPAVELVRRYPRDAADAIVPTDVYSFHADRAPVHVDTYLCTYAGAPSEGLANEDAIRKVDVPELRAELLRRYGGPDDERFRAQLEERCLDLHYQPRPGARVYSFGVGALWRIAVAHPGSLVPPCIHRAPHETGPRLLLIA